MEFKIFEEKLQITDDIDNYVNIRKKYEKIATELSNDFVNLYIEQNKNIEDVSKNAEQQGLYFIEEAINTAIDELIEKEIYEVDKDKFINKYYKKYFDYIDYYDEINEKYLEIVLNEKDLDEYRTNRRLSRGRWEGGGFGLGGAIQGSAMAGAMNLATNVAHGIFNTGAKIVTSGFSMVKKSNIFKDPETLRTLKNGVYQNIFKVHYALVNILQEYKKGSYKLVTNEDRQKYTAIFNNLEKIKDNKDNRIFELFLLNPYDTRLYDYIINNELYNKVEISKIADYFGVDITSIFDLYLSNVFNDCEKDDEEKVLLLKKEIEEKMDEIGLSESNTLKKVLDLLEEIDIEKRTFKNYIYETREEKAQAEEEDEKLKELCKDILNHNKFKLFELEKNIKDTNYIGNVSEEYICLIQNRIDEIENIEFDRILKENKKDTKEDLLNIMQIVSKANFSLKNKQRYEETINKKIYRIENPSLANKLFGKMLENKENIKGIFNKFKK